MAFPFKERIRKFISKCMKKELNIVASRLDKKLTHIEENLNTKFVHLKSEFDEKIKKIIKFDTLKSYLSARLHDLSDVVLLHHVLSFRLFGVPFPNKEDYMAFADKVEKYQHSNPPKDPNAGNIRNKTYYFDFMDFPELKIPLQTFSFTSSAKLFYAHQYDHPKVHIEEGDYIIDAGCLFGDTSLWFSYLSNGGKVFSFEFIPPFVERMEANFKRNEKYGRNITIAEYAVWNTSGEEMCFSEDGGKSRLEPGKSTEVRAETITIDDYVKSNGIKKIDFIKMDIEGAEVNALLGAKETIQKYRPKLAICLYHKDSDFIDVPALIDSFGVDYDFYLGHHTHFASETVLYAITNRNTDEDTDDKPT